LGAEYHEQSSPYASIKLGTHNEVGDIDTVGEAVVGAGVGGAVYPAQNDGTGVEWFSQIVDLIQSACE
jgi:hypothetical protein